MNKNKIRKYGDYMTQITVKDFNELIGIKESYEAPNRLMEIIYNKEERIEIMKKFLELTNFEVDFDTFSEYFQEVQADRKGAKQDFTPQSVSKLVAKLVNINIENQSENYDGCAGTGGMTISKWHEDRIKHSPFDYKPSWYLYTCEELSSAAIPFLLFNLILRGMNAIVIHGNTLTREAYGVFFVQNDRDDHMMFSELNLMPYNETVLDEFNLYGWIEEKYDEIIESEGVPMHVVKNMMDGIDYSPSDATKLLYRLCGIDC